MSRFYSKARPIRRSRRRSFYGESLEPRRVLDSTVVFNELMYNPVEAESHEWIELHNQMSVAVDLSNWTLEGGVDYQFPEGTLLRGGEYLVVASDPSYVHNQYGLDVLGPFNGRLSNGGETIELRNHSDRLMNRIEYSDGRDRVDPWPAGADGVGASLAKFDAQSASEDPANWTVSTTLGGTPGEQNFVPLGSIDRRVLVSLDQEWRYDDSGEDLGTAWREADFDDSQWASGPALLYREDSDLAGPKNTRLDIGHATHYFRTSFEFDGDPSGAVVRFRHLVDDGAVFYLNGHEVDRFQMPDGEITSSTLAAAITADAEPITGNAIEPTLLRQGQNTIAVEVHQNSVNSNDIVFGAELWFDQRVVAPSAPEDTIRISETSGAGPDSWVELTNPGTTPANLSGWRLADTDGGSYTITDLSIGPGESVVVSSETMGFGTPDGERLYLLDGTGNQLVDTVRVSRDAQGRSDEHDGRWQRVSAVTPGTPNEFDFHDQVVINEIMYHDRPTYAAVYTDPPREFAESPEEWIELYNKGPEAIDISGWRLAGGIRFEVPNGTVLAPNEYVVVAGDEVTLADQYPDIRILGEFDGGLSNVDDHLLLLDAIDNLADEVHYYEGGYWTDAADGGGSSLELMDANADNSRPSAWAASDETQRSQWHSVSYVSTVENYVYRPEVTFNELYMGLLDAGEVLVDNLSVKELRSDGTTFELIQNGDFDGDIIGAVPDKWRNTGTHRESVVIEDPTDPTNRVLRVRATSRMNYLSNHTETTFVDNTSIELGKTYQISYDAKWITGSPQLLTELHQKDAARTTIIEQPDQSGTPGRRNSVAVENLGPTFETLQHAPVIPTDLQDVTVSVFVDDQDGVSEVNALYRMDGVAEFSSVRMTMGDDGRFSAELPPHPDGTVVQFYVQAVDAQGNSSVYPPAGPDSRALYRVENGFGLNPNRQTMQLLTTKADADHMNERIYWMDNHHRGSTVVIDGLRAFYDTGTRYRGTMHTRRFPAQTGYNVRFRPDELFRGVHDSVILDQGGEQEIVLKFVNNQSGNYGGSYDDIVELTTPSGKGGGPTQLFLARQSDIYLEEQFGSDAGTVFKLEGIKVPSATVDPDDPESPKIYLPINGWGFDIEDLQGDKEVYRWPYLLNGNRAEDDYSGIIAMAKAFSAPDEGLEQTVAEVLDMESWTKTFAFMSLMGVSDTYSQGSAHNLNIYVPKSGVDIKAMPWDWDSMFDRDVDAPLIGGANISRIFAIPTYHHLHMGYMHDLISTVLQRDYLTDWIEDISRVADTNHTGFIDNAERRARFVQSQFPARVPFTAGATGVRFVEETVVDGNSLASILIPSRSNGGASLGTTWTLPEFTPSDAWLSGGAAVGFERASAKDYGPFISTPVPEMKGENASIFVRIPFTLDDVPDETSTIQLGMRYDDGFVASLNGVQIAAANAPDNLSWNSDADGSHANNEAVLLEKFDISEYHHLFVPGENVLTIQGLNSSVNNSDALFDPQLIINRVELEGISDEPITTQEPVVEIEGVGWINVHQLRLRGQDTPLPLQWDTLTEWRTSVPTAAGTNTIELEAYDFQGELIGTQSLVVTSTGGGSESEFLRISELMYHPVDPTTAERLAGFDDEDHFEFVELVNTSHGAEAVSLSLNGFTFGGGIDFQFPDVQLGAGERIVVAANPAALRMRYGDVGNVIGPYDRSLSNAGEQLVLSDAQGVTVLDMEYDDRGLWPAGADGVGASLVGQDPTAPSNQAAKHYHWRPSTDFGGSPGKAGTGPVGVVINEIVARPGTDNDVIELYNTSSDSVDLSRAYLSDDIENLAKYKLPAGTVIPAGEYLVIDTTVLNDANHFDLDEANGGRIWLVLAEENSRVAAFVDDVEFDGNRLDESQGRWPNGTGRLASFSTPTIGIANVAPHASSVVISEVHYRPAPPAPATIAVDPTISVDDLEFVELTNVSTSSIDLADWRLRGGVDFDFDSNTELPSGAAIIVASFDPSSPANADLVAAFRAEFSIPDTVLLVGGFEGGLNNGADYIRLLSRDSVADGLSRRLEDEIVYDDLEPWPSEADGGGSSLNRDAVGQWGTLADAWAAALPNPGIPSRLSVHGDLDGDQTVNAADIDLFCARMRMGNSPQSHDLNGDALIDDGDLDFLIEDLLGTTRGDTDLNGRFDSEDIVAVFSRGQYNDGVLGNSGWESGDWNCDGEFDSEDIVAARIAGGYRL